MRGEVLTDAQRAELTKQFDQRLAQRQVHQQAMRQACQGKKTGLQYRSRWVNTPSMANALFVSSLKRLPINT